MLSHWFALLGRALWEAPSRIGSNWGGIGFTILLVLIGLFFKGNKMRAHWQENVKSGLYAALIGWTGLWAISVVFTIYDDHQNMVGACKRIKDAGELKYKTLARRMGKESGDLRNQVSDLKTSCAVKDGVNVTLLKQNGDQQATINNCLTQAISLVKPPRLDITAIILRYALESEKNTYTNYLLLTNIQVSPVRLRVSCTENFRSNGGMYLSGVGSMQIGGSEQLGAREYRVNIETGAWTPKIPLQVQVSWAGAIGTCSFREE